MRTKQKRGRRLSEARGSVRRKLTPWQKIIRAAKRSTGLRLNAEEIGRLSMDDAIETRARNDDELEP